MSKVQSKEKIHKIRKQILLAKLKSDATKGIPQNYTSGLHGPGIESKIDLWKKKGKLEQQIIEKKKQIDDLRANIYKRAQTIQSEGNFQQIGHVILKSVDYKPLLLFLACRLAEAEKQNADLKEKLLLFNILIGKHKNAVKEYKEKVKEIQSFVTVSHLEDIKYNKDKILVSVLLRNSVINHFCF